MKMKTFNISLPAEIVELIDTQAKLCYETRSSYIKHILIKALRNAGAFELQTIDNPEKLSRALRAQKLKAYLENLELTNDDLRN
jgi:hypothetical protein